MKRPYHPVVLKIRNKAHAQENNLPHMSPDHLWWSNDTGWGTREAATRFSHREHYHVTLPIGGEWYRADNDR